MQKKQLAKIALYAALLGRYSLVIACLGIAPLHAKDLIDGKFNEIINSEFYKNFKVPKLVEVNHGQSRMDDEKAKIARKEANRIYKILMKDEVPDLKISDDRFGLRGKREDGMYVIFDYDYDYNLRRVQIAVSHSETKFSARSEVRLAPTKTFQEIFGHPPIGKLKRSNTRVVNGGIVGGSAYWEINWPKNAEYEGDYGSSSLRWDETKGKVRGWIFYKGMKAEFTKKVTDLLQTKPVKINVDQAIASAHKSARSLGLPIDTRGLPRTQLCYYNIPYVSLDKKRWRAKNKPNIDGLSAMFGIHVSFQIPDSFSSVNVMVDHQTGEVLYVGTSF